ncbi:MAG: sensor histidine kinase, partial [Coriobacteriia bacterium]|nr:sensor histidine kinase [Coriobacteriia bacterium]
MNTSERAPAHHADPADAARTHLDNIAQNVQLLADLGYSDIALAEPSEEGTLLITADARPNTALAATPASRVGDVLRPEDEEEAYRALESGNVVSGERRRITRGIAYATTAYPIGRPSPYGVVIRNTAETVLEAPGAMETAFMDSAEDLLHVLCEGPVLGVTDDSPFSTVREAGDGLLRIAEDRTVAYASPNAVNILRFTGAEVSLKGRPTSEIPGAASAIGRVLGTTRGVQAEVSVADRVLVFRAIGLGKGAVVLLKDVTEERRRQQELKVKEATIREVHHRVKNNLQTIASLLRIQARRAETDEAQRALAEAMERVSSMAVVHEMLAGSTEERIDFTSAAETVVEMVRHALAGETKNVTVKVEGSAGLVPAQIATSLALVLAELVHNAIEHGLAGR